MCWCLAKNTGRLLHMGPKPGGWVGGRLTASAAVLSLLQRSHIHFRGGSISQHVNEMFVCSLWCLAGLASSEITRLAGVGRLGFRMQLYGGALTPVV